ncbi:hypothetical protein ABID95_001253 [Streptomyces atratus]
MSPASLSNIPPTKGSSSWTGLSPTIRPSSMRIAPWSSSSARTAPASARLKNSGRLIAPVPGSAQTSMSSSGSVRNGLSSIVIPPDRGAGHFSLHGATPHKAGRFPLHVPCMDTGSAEAGSGPVPGGPSTTHRESAEADRLPHGATPAPYEAREAQGRRLPWASLARRMLSRYRIRCLRCPASGCTTRFPHRHTAFARGWRRARPVVRTQLRAWRGARPPRARCRPGRRDAPDS